MGKKNKGGNSSLGRALIKDRFGGQKTRKFVDDNSLLHTTEIQDGYDWGRLNLQSVTEESSFQEFLSTAELAGTEFQAEKLNIKFINPHSNVGLLTKDEMKKAKEDQKKHKDIIKIPRRPAWDAQTTPEELQQNERESFLEWRRSLAKLQEDEGMLLTPYEKNLEFWRQLWRVVERSDVVIQIVDARNPLLFRCEDLEKYVKEISKDKENMILVNKADFLTEEQRQHWADYFSSIGVRVAFFSAVLATEKETIEEHEEEIKDISEEYKETLDNEENTSTSLEYKDTHEENEETSTSEEYEDTNDEESSDRSQNKELHSKNKETLKDPDTLKKVNITSEIKENVTLEEIRKCADNLSKEVEEASAKLQVIFNRIKNVVNSSELLTREGLIELFRNIHKGPKVNPNTTTIGLVGYPNVGKSSTINALMTVKKVSVSATPGKTKHFQTLYLEKDLLLCDCPGLVMPSFVFTKAEMVVNGILPIDQMRDHVPPINLVNHLIPRHVLEDKYGIMLPEPMEGEDENRPPTAEELLNAYGYNRGFMTANGQPDNPRSSRYILKDFMNGKLLYAHAPPTIKQEEYHTWPERQRIASSNHIQPPREIRASKPNRMTSEDLDKIFFRNSHQGIHAKGKLGKTAGLPTQGISSQSNGVNLEKPWKKINKHENKKKKEKLRRVYAHLDQH